jgi:hypothetical protein
MLISKDVLQHLSNSEIVSLLKLFSNYRLLLLCNDVFVPWRNPIALLKYYLQVRRRLRALVAFRNPFFVQSRKNNHDIKSGDGRGIDLLEPPFAEELRGHKLKCQLDFKGSGSRNNGTVKRLYFFERQEINA